MLARVSDDMQTGRPQRGVGSEGEMESTGDIAGSIVDSVAVSRSASYANAKCNARGAVDGAREMARHASGTIAQWWFGFLELGPRGS